MALPLGRASSYRRAMGSRQSWRRALAATSAAIALVATAVGSSATTPAQATSAPPVQTFFDVYASDAQAWAVTLERRDQQVCTELAVRGITSVSYVHVYRDDSFLFAAPAPGTCTSALPTATLDALTSSPEQISLSIAGDPIGVLLNQLTWCDGGFPDVPVGATFCLPVDYLASRGVIGGYPDGTFRPAATITRQAVVAMLWRLAGEPLVLTPTPTFSDVPPGHPFEHAIRWAAHDPPGPAGAIVTGYADGTFRPGLPVSRQALAAFLHRMAGAPTTTPGFPVAFTDVPPDHPFALPIMWARGTGIIGGYPDNTFRPSATATRQAVASFLHRFNAWAIVDGALPGKP